MFLHKREHVPKLAQPSPLPLALCVSPALPSLLTPDGMRLPALNDDLCCTVCAELCSRIGFHLPNLIWCSGGTPREGRTGLNVHSTEGKGLCRRKWFPWALPADPRKPGKWPELHDCLLPLPRAELGLQMALSTL